MPPQLQALLQNRNALIIIGVAVVAILIFSVIGFSGGGGGSANDPKLNEQDRLLAEVETIGKAIEVQALLAREGIRIDRVAGDGGRSKLLLSDGATQSTRDHALITLVQSGLMDKNVGLEAFDKGDLTASREEKRIKLIRAQQGELARLIRKIDPIQDASVSLSIPEQTMFRSQQKPMSASVQVTVPNGERLNRDKVRSIINLMVGSIQGLDAQHVALADTNGNTYNSVLDTGSELNDKLEEQDQYMKQKVASQLDKLVGPGNYVVTVATQLREAPKETLVETYDPNLSAIREKQSFTENLNSHGGEGVAGGPVSSLLAKNLATTSAAAIPGSKDYVRSGIEESYANAKTQYVETLLPGMIEDISIAVTIDHHHFPQGIAVPELKQLLAHAASPKVIPEHVSIATADFQKPSSLLIPDANASEDGGESINWIPWAAGALGVCLLLILLLSMGKSGSNKPPVEFQEAQRELQQLRDFAAQQQAQLQATQQQTQMLLEAQQQQLAQQQAPAKQIPQTTPLQETLEELKEMVSDEEDLDLQIKSWIESS